MSNYWNLREIKEREQLLDLFINKTEIDLSREYRRLSNRISKEMTSLYEKIIANGEKGVVNANDLYRFNRYYELLNNIQQELYKSGIRITALYNRHFYNLYKENSLLVGKQFNLATTINEETAKKVINAVWVNDGKNWSDRLWANQTLLANKLEQGMIDCVSAGYSPDLLKQSLMNIFNTSYHNASTLARTELAHIYTQSTIEKYREAGITHYKFLATPDERECSQCQELNGKTFPLDEVKIPVHPNCRCTTLAVLEKDK